MTENHVRLVNYDKDELSLIYLPLATIIFIVKQLYQIVPGSF